MKVHLVQLDIAWEDKDTNHTRVRDLLLDTQPDSGDLVILPELFDVGFSLNTDIAIDQEKQTQRFLQQISNETGCIIHGSRALASSEPDLAINCATICAPGHSNPICEYAKVHPFSYGRETESYTGGSEIKLYNWDDLAVCPSICYDLRFPELYRLAVKQGACVFAHGANWPATRQKHWRTLNIARAIENQSFVFAVNRCGNDPYLPYAGGSLAIDPKGEVLLELGADETVGSVQIDTSLLAGWRSDFPALKDIKLI